MSLTSASSSRTSPERRGWLSARTCAQNASIAITLQVPCYKLVNPSIVSGGDEVFGQVAPVLAKCDAAFPVPPILPPIHRPAALRAIGRP
jgi:hypothetical protein